MESQRFFSAAALLMSAAVVTMGLTACGGGKNTGSAVTAGSAPAASSAVTSSTVSTEESANTKQMAYVKSFDAGSGTLVVDPVEWITKEDTERIRELKLNSTEDFPNGYYIYNPSQKTETLQLNRDADLSVLKWNSVGVAEDSQRVSPEQFAQRLKQDDAFYPYRLAVKDGQVLELYEKYVP